MNTDDVTRSSSWRSPQVFVPVLVFAVLAVVNALALMHVNDRGKKAEILAAGTLSLAGTVVGAALAFWYARSMFREQERALELRRKSDLERTLAEQSDRIVDRTLDMKRQFDDGHTYKARLDADCFLKKDPVQTIDLLYEQHSAEEEAHAIFLVSSFYEQLARAIEFKKLYEALVSPLFGQTFYWWYYVCFKPQMLSLDWPSCEAVRYLKNWFDNHPTAHTERWKNRGRSARDQRVRDWQAAQAAHKTS